METVRKDLITLKTDNDFDLDAIVRIAGENGYKAICSYDCDTGVFSVTIFEEVYKQA